MHESSERIVRTLRDPGQLAAFCTRLSHWLAQEGSHGEEQVEAITNSRAKSLLRVSAVVDDATLKDFGQLLQAEPVQRITLFDLLADTALEEDENVVILAQMPTVDESGLVSWLTLIVAAYAWRSGYPSTQFDASSPPSDYSPAGQVLKRSAQFIRRQVQRSATEREQLARRLSAPPSGVPALDELEEGGELQAPLPPHYRPPVPVRYPEIESETVQVDPDELESSPTVEFGDPLVLTEEELAEPSSESTDPVRMPPITITRDQVTQRSSQPPSPMPSSGVVMPSPSPVSESRSSFTVGLRQMLGHEDLTTTKLKVLVQHYPDGPGFYGLQVRVTCKGVKSYVAGTTDRDGKFVCELPVRVESGLTYDIDVTWPREEGSDVERKSITLNADRTYFSLPFYRHLEAPSGE